MNPEEIKLMPLNPKEPDLPDGARQRLTGTLDTPPKILGAVTPNKNIWKSALNPGYPVVTIIIFFFWNLGFILLSLSFLWSFLTIKWEEWSTPPEWMPTGAYITVLLTIVLIFSTKTVEKCSCIVFVTLLVLSLSCGVTFLVLTWPARLREETCYKEQCLNNNDCSITDSDTIVKSCVAKLEIWERLMFYSGLDICRALIFSFGSVFLWRRTNQKPLSQLFCPVTKSKDTVFDYQLAVVVKTNNFKDKTTEITLHIVADDNLDDIVDKRDVTLTSKYCCPSSKRSIWHPPLALCCTASVFISVGFIDPISLLPSSNYTAKVISEGPLRGETFQFSTPQINGDYV